MARAASARKLCRRVQQSIQALGFEPDFLAQSWRTRVTRTIAAVVSDNTSPHHGIMLREAGAVALAHDYSLILCITYFDPEIENRYLRMLRLRRVDGVLLNNIGDCREHVRKFTEAGVPVVLLNRPLCDDGPLVDAVVVDSYRGAFDLVDHLIRVGHRRIAMVYDQGLHEYHKSERLRGYREALRAHGLAYDEDLVRCGNFQSGRVHWRLFAGHAPANGVVRGGLWHRAGGDDRVARARAANSGGHCFCDV